MRALRSAAPPPLRTPRRRTAAAPEATRLPVHCQLPCRAYERLYSGEGPSWAAGARSFASLREQGRQAGSRWRKRGAMERQLSHRPFIQATPGKRRAASGGQVAGVRRRSSCRLLSPPGAPNPHAPWSYVCTAVRLHSHACELHASCVHRALVGRQPCVLGVRIRCLLPQHLHKRQAAALLRLQAVFTAKEYVLQGASKVCA